jgi:hypothetical protein
MEYEHHSSLDGDFKEYRLALIAAAAIKIRNKKESTWRPSIKPLKILPESPPEAFPTTTPNTPIAKTIEAITEPPSPTSKQSDYKGTIAIKRKVWKRDPLAYCSEIKGKATIFPFYCGDRYQLYYSLNGKLDKTLIHLLMLKYESTFSGFSFRTYHNRNGKQYTANHQALEWLVEELNKNLQETIQ